MTQRPFASPRRARVIVTSLLACLLLAASAAQAQPGLKSESLWKWQFVGNPQISPDGTKIAYVHVTVDDNKDNYRAAIWLAELPSGRLRQLTAGAGRDTSPRWSPDGTRLAFLSNRAERSQIFVLAMDGGEARQVTRLRGGAGNIEWSPDGRQIAFTSRVGPPPEEEKNEPGKERAKKEMVITRLTYRTDGAGYRPEGYMHIFTVDADGNGEPRQITSGDFDHGAPAWSPDGRTIALSAIRKPDADFAMGDSEIYVVPAAGGEIRQLTDRRGPDSGPIWSPDGKQIAFTGSDEKLLSYTLTRLYVMNADGSGRRELTSGYDRSVGDGVIGDVSVPVGGAGEDIAWSPDGKRILFLSADRGSNNIRAVPVEGGAVTEVTRGDHDLNSFTIARNGQIAAVMASPTEPFDLYRLSLADAKPRRLTSVNAENVKDAYLSPAEMFWYPSFDGMQMQAWVLKPPGFAPSKKYPLILYIHGGPHAMYGNTFFHEFQMLAGRGYVVLFTNPRGSSGYGQEFGNIIQYKYPGDDAKDLLVGVDELLKRGYVDEKRMGITGGSGGGVLTSWIIGQTQRFAAAAPDRGVYNWSSFVATADFNYNFARRWFRGFPWEDPDDYYRRSPVNYVQNITTPTLVVHYEEDWRVPISQGEELYTRIKMLRKTDVKMVRYPEEPHGLSRMGRPSRRVSRLEHIAGWFDNYLNPAP